MTRHDPPTLADPSAGASAVLRAAVVAARAGLPSPEDLASLGSRLPITSSPWSNSPGLASSGTAAAGGVSGSLLGAGLLGGLLGALVSGAILLEGPAAPPPAPPAVSAAVFAGPPEPPRPAVELRRSQPAVLPRPPEKSAVVVVPVAAPVPERPSAPSDPPAETGIASVPAPAGAPLGNAEVAGDAETETHLLQRAQEALSRDPTQALALAAVHARRFPRGALVQEREVVAIQALERLGRRDEAEARAQNFGEAFPGSAHRRRVDRLTGK